MIGKVLEFLRGEVDGAKVADTVVDPGGGANLSAHHYGPPGDDSPPLAGDYAALVDGPGRGNVLVVGYADTKNAGAAAGGERRLYGRKPDGTVVAVVWLKGDGTVVITNEAGGSIEMAGSDGTVTINGVTISPAGALSVPGPISADGEVTAMAAVTAIPLSTHIHGETGTNTGPPQAPPGP